MSLQYSNALKTLVSEVVLNSKPLDKSNELFFKSIPAIKTHDKETLFHLITFVIRYWITIHEIYKNLFSARNIDFHEILHIQQILENHVEGRYICSGKYEKLVIDNYKLFSEVRHVRESFPKWLDNVCFKELGAEWDLIAKTLNKKSEPILRVNTLKTNLQEVIFRMNASGKNVTSIDGYSDAVRVKKYFDIFRSEEFQSGFFEMQDAGSQKIAPFLDAEAGMRVIDACAGNGGKTLHLSALMKNKGKIIALDIAPYKLEVLKKRMKRAGAFNIETKSIDSHKIIKRLHNSADRLLLDVPCSGTGVLKRNPDIKYHLSEEKLKSLYTTQQEILERYSLMVNKNGLLVYSTCSILPSENQQQIQSFLEKKQGSFELIEEKTISPLNGFDGFYMAKLKRSQ